MTENFIGFLPQDHPMIYYLLPNVVKRRCLALKKISLEHEALDNRYRKARQSICKKYSSQIESSISNPRNLQDEQNLLYLDNNNNDHDHDEVEEEEEMKEGSRTGEHYEANLIAWPFETNPWLTIVQKADDLKSVATSSWSAYHHNLVNSNLSNSNSLNLEKMRELLSNCESKCHEILTHLANIDWEFFEYEETLLSYHNEIEDIMTQYNVELNSLYKRRFQIITGEREPSNEEINLPDYLSSSATFRPKYFDLEQINQRIYSVKYSAEAEKLMGQLSVGVPEFWLQALTIALRSVGIIEAADRAPLKHLIDVRFYYDLERELPEDSNQQLSNTDYRTQLLLFFFNENPHFSNRILSKTFYIDKSRRSGRQMFDQIWITKKEGCTINWYADKDITRLPLINNNNHHQERGWPLMETLEDHQQEGEAIYPNLPATAAPSNQYQSSLQPPSPLDESRLDSCRRPSFFNFFSGRGLPENGRKIGRPSSRNATESCDDDGDASDKTHELDYDVFAHFRDFIVPHAVIAYSRGNLYGFESERQESRPSSNRGSGLKQKQMYWLNTLLD